MKDWFAFEQIESKAAEPAALGHDQSLRTIFGDVHHGTDPERLVLEVGCGALRDADHSVVVGERITSLGQARAILDIETFHFAVVQWQCIILDSFDVEQTLQFGELFRVPFREIVRLREVIIDVVEFPLLRA